MARLTRLERVQVWLGSGVFALLVAMTALTRGVTWHLLSLLVWLGAMYLLVRSRGAYLDGGPRAALGWAAGAVVLGLAAAAILIGELPSAP